MIIIDGYNLMHASEELARLASGDLESARDELVGRLADYAAASGMDVEVVFDGAGGATVTSAHSDFLAVTFTGKGKTADEYIEGVSCGSAESGRRYDTVVTGDYHQQKVVYGAGMLRMSSREFLEEMRQSRRETDAGLRERTRPRGRTRLEKRLPADVKAALLRIRNRRSP